MHSAWEGKDQVLKFMFRNFCGSLLVFWITVAFDLVFWQLEYLWSRSRLEIHDGYEQNCRANTWHIWRDWQKQSMHGDIYTKSPSNRRTKIGLLWFTPEDSYEKPTSKVTKGIKPLKSIVVLRLSAEVRFIICHSFVTNLVQLEQAIIDFAEGLRVAGVQPEQTVALFADNSHRWLIADQGKHKRMWRLLVHEVLS